MIKPYYKFFQVHPVTYRILDRWISVFFVSLACYEMGTKQLHHLKNISNTSIWEVIEPFLRHLLQRDWKVAAISCIINILHVHLCIMSIQIIVMLIVYIKGVEGRYLDFLGCDAFIISLVKGVEKEGRDLFLRNLWSVVRVAMGGQPQLAWVSHSAWIMFLASTPLAALTIRRGHNCCAVSESQFMASQWTYSIRKLSLRKLLSMRVGTWSFIFFLIPPNAIAFKSIWSCDKSRVGNAFLALQRACLASVTLLASSCYKVLCSPRRCQFRFCWEGRESRSKLVF